MSTDLTRPVVVKGNGAVFAGMAATLDALCDQLNLLEQAKVRRDGFKYDPSRDYFDWLAGPKWVKINRGNCGVWMVDINSGELYNIQGYGRPDHNKKRKADIGNLFTVDARVLYTKQYNYLNHHAATDTSGR